MSGRAGELDRVRGFERGSDDYVCKPFSYPELRGRLAAVLRRSDRRRQSGRLRVGELVVDPASRDGQRRRSAGRPVTEGVRAAARARDRADARVHQGGAAALDLGVSRDGYDSPGKAGFGSLIDVIRGVIAPHVLQFARVRAPRRACGGRDDRTPSTHPARQLLSDR